jgi:acyl-CoA reductase-like NAD-dependent aldehyde dehydrogenase
VVAGIRTFGFYNAGQDCTAACRIYAQGKIYDKFVAAMTEAVASIKVGGPREEGWRWGRSSRTGSATGWPASWSGPRAAVTWR